LGSRGGRNRGQQDGNTKPHFTLPNSAGETTTV